MTEDSFQEAKVDWTHIPSLQALEFHIGTVLGFYKPTEKFAIRLKRPPKFSLNPDEYILHRRKSVKDLVEMYENNGFETRVILQDPFGHKGPTVACPIGFPFNLPNPSPQLRRFNRWICRVHVEIAYSDEILLSVPHIEPDPAFHKLAHLWDTFIKKHVIRGEEAVAILKFLGVQ